MKICDLRILPQAGKDKLSESGPGLNRETAQKLGFGPKPPGVQP